MDVKDFGVCLSPYPKRREGQLRYFYGLVKDQYPVKILYKAINVEDLPVETAFNEGIYSTTVFYCTYPNQTTIKQSIHKNNDSVFVSATSDIYDAVVFYNRFRLIADGSPPDFVIYAFRTHAIDVTEFKYPYMEQRPHKYSPDQLYTDYTEFVVPYWVPPQDIFLAYYVRFDPETLGYRVKVYENPIFTGEKFAINDYGFKQAVLDLLDHIGLFQFARQNPHSEPVIPYRLTKEFNGGRLKVFSKVGKRLG